MAEILFHPEATAEYRHELRWYARQSLRAAERFERAIVRVIGGIQQNPVRHGYYDDIHREAILPRYPFSIIYRVLSDGNLFVVAIAHASREPGYWELRSA